jgi:predicted neuraminidase
MKHGSLIMSCMVLGALSAVAAPVFEMESIFPPQEKHVHSSSIVECPNGDLLVCWFHGSGERTANDVQVQGARKPKGEGPWSPVFVMADTQDLPDCNPVLFIDEQKRLWLFWAAVVANGWEHSLLKYRRAEDYQGDGPPNWSWQDVIILKPGDGFPGAIKKGFEQLEAEEGCWAEYALPYEEYLVEAAKDKMKRQKGWMTRIHPAVLPSGRILLPLYSDGYNLSLIGITDDLGETWHASQPIVGYGPTQPSIVRKKNGSLVAYLRDEGNAPQRVQVTSSNDDGETWTPSVDIDIPNPSSSLEVLVLKDGRWLMLCNDTDVGRHRLVLMISDDEGATWQGKRQLEPCDAGGQSFEYPSIIQSRDGLIHMSYTRHSDAGKTIAHCSVNLEWLGAE